MTETVNLTIKIDPELKETIKQLALENQISMSQEIVQRLQASLETHPHPAIDNQDITEAAAEASAVSDAQADGLSASELKQIRLLLKKQSKKKK
ncbi:MULTISPECIES: Arc family DNA-binding protein [unclassified Pantoea]|uniref:Arc family DNA-binding protein n=1 Tax=unclassified Pantoea TaxID=2630326 RepID=UPI001231DB97|nr:MULTISPECIES: Arc family DNA-binding protein [unclassified Pantoea]KAA5970338.1 Arc family DNA-binding protein [Pantoea sp. M_6]KAA5976447.1 Arc family DNA-binding protein [Pantoea sp. M_8]KAA5987733.1 Arc family DNA-binding protein [Pantoea sp. M_10]KAA6001476.1 Arc family DNA-binding protein [Pantoea sp. M_5]